MAVEPISPDGADPSTSLNFFVTSTLGASRARLRLHGELDLAGAERVRAAFRGACSSECSLVLVDLSEVTFCDSSGIHALLFGRDCCERNGMELRVVGVAGIVRRVFEIANLHELFDVRDDP